MTTGASQEKRQEAIPIL